MLGLSFSHCYNCALLPPLQALAVEAPLPGHPAATRPSSKPQALSCAAHLSFFVAVLIEVSWVRSFSDACVDISELFSEEDSMNPDIGGVVVRYSMHILAVTTILCTVANHFGVEGFGVKELGIAQLTSMVLRDLFLHTRFTDLDAPRSSRSRTQHGHGTGTWEKDAVFS